MKRVKYRGECLYCMVLIFCRCRCWRVCDCLCRRFRSKVGPSFSSVENCANYGYRNDSWPDYGGRGVRFLLLDLGDPSIAFNVFLRPSSILGFGSWAIALFCLFAVLSLAFGLMPHCRASKLIEPLSQFLAMVLSLVVILYSGVFYSLFPSVPFLNTPLEEGPGRRRLPACSGKWHQSIGLVYSE